MRIGRGNGPVFLGDWREMVFLHYEVDADALQEAIPFPLDLHEGKAYVSLVAFTMLRFRPAFGGRWTRWLTAGMKTQRFLNVRTYVRGARGRGIFFQHEWLDHPLAVRLGPATFGLPYRRGSLSYQTHPNGVSGTVVVTSGNHTGLFRGQFIGPERMAAPGSLEEFLVERYTAYTAAGFRPLAFRVWHEPWTLRTIRMEDETMETVWQTLRQPWTESLRFVGATYSEGVHDVWMGRPRFA